MYFDVFVDVLLMCFADMFHKLSTSLSKRKTVHYYVLVKHVGSIIYSLYIIVIRINHPCHIPCQLSIPWLQPFPPGDGPGSGPVPLREAAARLAAVATAGGGGGDHQQLDAAGATAGGTPEDLGG